MGTIIRITGDGVFIESCPKDGSMETSFTDSLDKKMCNLSNNVDQVIDVDRILQHTITYDCTDDSGHQMTRTKSSFLNSRGQCSG